MYTRAKVAGCIIPCDLSSRAEQPHPISHPISYPSASTAIAESSSYPINDPLVKQLYHGCVENILRRTTVGGWPSGYRASFLPAIFPSRYATSYPIWSSSYIRSATLSAVLWPSAHRRQISSGVARGVVRGVVL